MRNCVRRKHNLTTQTQKTTHIQLLCNYRLNIITIATNPLKMQCINK